jgi:hypothetical protein
MPLRLCFAPIFLENNAMSRNEPTAEYVCGHSREQHMYALALKLDLPDNCEDDPWVLFAKTYIAVERPLK